MDFERIRLDSANLCKSRVNRKDGSDPFADIVDEIIEKSSVVCKVMIEKYHEELSKSK